MVAKHRALTPKERGALRVCHPNLDVDTLAIRSTRDCKKQRSKRVNDALNERKNGIGEQP